MTSSELDTAGKGPRRGRRPGGRTQDRSERIFAAAVEVLTTDGYVALTFQDVAERAGISRSTLYRRWPTKAELALDVIAHALESTVTAPDTGSFAGDLRASLLQIGVFLASPMGGAAIAAGIEMARVAQNIAGRRALWDRRLANFVPLFERAKARGELPQDFDVEAALAATSGAMMYRVLFMARPIDDEWIDRTIAMVSRRSPKNQ